LARLFEESNAIGKFEWSLPLRDFLQFNKANKLTFSNLKGAFKKVKYKLMKLNLTKSREMQVFCHFTNLMEVINMLKESLNDDLSAIRTISSVLPEQFSYIYLELFKIGHWVENLDIDILSK